MNLNNLKLETEEITIKGKKIKIFRPARLEDIFQGDPFLDVEKFPFWSKIWEASVILADYIATIESPKKILEIGAGLGLPSLVAASCGHEVTASDLEELALKLLKYSAKENSLNIKTILLDWRNPKLEEKFDIIMGAEVVFKKSLFEPLLNLFENYLRNGGEVLLSHSSERKRVLIPFLYQAQKKFDILTSVRKLKSKDETIEIVLNKLIFKKS